MDLRGQGEREGEKSSLGPRAVPPGGGFGCWGMAQEGAGSAGPRVQLLGISDGFYI